jgi:hypothetical protein
MSSVLVVIYVLGVLISCSSGPAGPEKGTPGYYWQAAKETFAAGDYPKTMEHLDNLLATDNQYVERALPWSLVLTSGMAGGYSDLADHYELGARVNRSDPSAFRRTTTQFRGLAKPLTLQFEEKFAKFQQLKGDTVALAFGYPKGAATPAPQLAKVANGMILQPADAELAQTHTLQRKVLLAACGAAGAPDDTAKGEAVLKDPAAKVPRATFEIAMAQALYNASQLYAPTKLDDPDKMQTLCERANDALKAVPASKDSKELGSKIRNALKKNKT